MTFPRAIEAFVRLPIWGPLFLLLSAGIAVYGGWSLLRSRQRADLYYMLIGLYLLAVQLPAVPGVGDALGVTWSPGGDMFSRVMLAAPAIGLYVLAVRAR